MQSTHYVPDEIEHKHGHREPCTLQAHNEFAEEVLGEKKRLTQPQAIYKGHTVLHDLLAFTSDRQWIYVVWGLEFLWLLFVVAVCSMEAWGACAFEMGITAVCQYCYSGVFLFWNAVMVAFWSLHLFLFVLLVSRGFFFKVRFLGLATSQNTAKGIPVNAIYLFWSLTAAIFLWLVAGVIVLVLSNSCLYGGPNSLSRPGRSVLMFWTTMFTLVLALPFLFFGRCGEGGAILKKARRHTRRCC